MQIIAAAAIPVSAVLIPSDYPAVLKGVTAALGALVAGIESYLQFRQYHQNWVRWRTAAEALRREVFLYAQKAGEYKGAKEPEILLAEKVEEILAVEQQSWRSLQENPHPPREAGH